MGFINVLRGLRRSYALSQLDLPLSDIEKYVRLAALLKRDILQPQPLPQSAPNKPPKYLPQSIACFLADALGVSREVSEHCWKVLKHDVWAAETHDKVKAADEDAFREHGWKYGLTFAHSSAMIPLVGSFVGNGRNCIIKEPNADTSPD
ncbi:hypothetical protein C8J56DRAFT_1032326 [Mycena floridula]|nr:hypothetical protein C8J56DRAFT_1032326 [Mycena floridula]